MECETRLNEVVIVNTDLQTSITLQESLVMSSIATETLDGKKKYPNESARVGELKKRLETAPTYAEKKDQLFDGTKSRKLIEIEHRFLLNRFSALKAVARMSEVD